MVHFEKKERGALNSANKMCSITSVGSASIADKLQMGYVKGLNNINRPETRVKENLWITMWIP